MEEYKIEMFRHGKWVRGHIPYVGSIQTLNTLKDAEYMVEIAKLKWHLHNCRESDKPTDWQIMYREISPWRKAE